MEILSVEEWIDDNQEELIGFLQQLVRIPSVTGSEGAIQEYLGGYLGGMGLDVDMFEPSVEELRNHPASHWQADSYAGRPNVVATWKGTGGGRSLLLNAHVDTIPPGPEENWRHGCWSGEVEDDKLYGRGAADSKSGVAAAAMAIKALRACGVRLQGDVLAEFVVEEERSGNGTIACIAKGYKADSGVCFEPSGMGVRTGSIGRIWFEMLIHGRTAGIQRHDDGVNAIDLGYLVTKIVAEYEAKRVEEVSHPLYADIRKSIPCMVGQFESGTYASAFPDSCRLKGSIATVPGEDSEQVKRDFVAFVLRRAAEESEWLKENPPVVDFTGYFAEPSAIPIDSPIVRTLANSFEQVVGVKPDISGLHGSADSRFLNEYGDTPSVIFSPGQAAQMHSIDEWVYSNDYLDSIKVLAQTIVNWCGVEE